MIKQKDKENYVTTGFRIRIYKIWQQVPVEAQGYVPENHNAEQNNTEYRIFLSQLIKIPMETMLMWDWQHS
jgi:hypothetical protein